MFMPRLIILKYYFIYFSVDNSLKFSNPIGSGRSVRPLYCPEIIKTLFFRLTA